MPALRKPQHEKLSQLVASGIKPVDAYIAVGYSKNGAAQSVSALLKNPKIAGRIKELLEQAAENTMAAVSFDQQRVLNRLDVLSRKAEDLEQIGAAVRCEELIGKARAMFTDKSVTMEVKSYEDLVKMLTPEQLDLVIATHPENSERETAARPN